LKRLWPPAPGIGIALEGRLD